MVLIEVKFNFFLNLFIEIKLNSSMKSKSQNSSLLSILLFIIILSLVYSVQNMISPNLQIISNFFGFGGMTAQLGVLTSTFTLVSGVSVVIFGYLADKIKRKGIVLGGTIVYSLFSIFVIFTSPDINGYYLFFFPLRQ